MRIRKLIVRLLSPLVPSAGVFIPNLLRAGAKPPTLDANIWRRLRITFECEQRPDARLPEKAMSMSTAETRRAVPAKSALTCCCR